ncbi:Eco57I restriction-modification methylase domain-containing protein [Bifidobacterium mongoliense]|uniref:site-specific DNA-methyltransferase (adenine-specific) n=1 Tax=Bifidobacterium mongoliense TaxID=518643 RepID=A0A423UBX5_9BIFI|nr:Eco57I restriction-modification methylase domain-containing protein [Bifidobacterium mongoliense]ROT86188.1 restriction endonuclease [Bifidobacterium mongoliense]
MNALTQAPFTLRVHNPDVLTCIANLSNDEVFTPPEIANAMLDLVASRWADSHDGASIWTDPTVTFLDPFTKSGVFLREITRRLVDGLATQFPDRQERVDHILTRQVYGIGITRLTALLARRSVYCSKFANGPHSIVKSFTGEDGNIWFQRTEHTWTGGQREYRVDPMTGDEKVVYTHRKCTYCGASEDDYGRGGELETHAYAFIHTDDIKARIGELFGGTMQFDVIIGNPPYQLNDGGAGASAHPIYNKFVESAKSLDPRYLSLVIPARWYSGGKGLNEFRQEMLNDARLSVIHDYPNTNDVFPGLNVRGGIMYFLWERGRRGNVTVTNHMGDKEFSSVPRPLLEPGLDTFIRFSGAVDIISKVVRVETGQADILSFSESLSFADFVSPRQPFGLGTNFADFSRHPTADRKIELFRFGENGYISEQQLAENVDWVNEWKLFVPYASPGNDDYPHLVLSNPIVAGPGTACTETYLVVGPFASESECVNARSYMKTQLFRFLVLTLRSSQHVTQRVYRLVPKLDFSASWDDRSLYEKYQITEDQIGLINTLVKPVAWKN